jgi:hypothetical protein
MIKRCRIGIKAIKRRTDLVTQRRGRACNNLPSNLALKTIETDSSLAKNGMPPINYVFSTLIVSVTAINKDLYTDEVCVVSYQSPGIKWSMYYHI